MDRHFFVFFKRDAPSAFFSNLIYLFFFPFFGAFFSQTVYTVKFLFQNLMHCQLDYFGLNKEAQS